MSGQVLVAFGTKHGSTREVAHSIAVTLREHDLVVKCLSASEVDDVSGFDGVVIGGALHMGRLHPAVRAFMHRNRLGLSRLPVAVFAMGPRTLEPKEVETSLGQLNHALAKEPELAPFAIAIFGGVFDPRTASFPFNRMPASDARDWDAIGEWAGEVAGVFATARVPVAV